MRGQAIVSIARIVSDKPESGTYFEVKNGWNTSEGNYRFQTTATDRWFVPEGKGLDLEDKLRK
jgi:hypothetical protein